MSTSTLPISERTVLLWANRWWLPGRSEPLEFGSMDKAADVLAAHFGTERGPVNLRLIYQPDSLASVPVACPKGNRATLQKVLSFEHPLIAKPEIAWGYDPILTSEEGFCTYLHYEQTAELFGLVAELAAYMIFVDSAWPLATFLHALPVEWSESGSVLVVAASKEAGIAYHHPAGGPRVHRSWRGEASAVEAGTWLRQVMNEHPDEPAWLLTTAPSEPIVEGLHHQLLTEALASPVVLPKDHPAQLLPMAPLLTPYRGAIAASILLLLAGGLSAAHYAHDYFAWSKGRGEALQEEAGLRTEIEHYRVNAQEIAALRTKLAGAGESPPVTALLAAACEALPTQLAFDRIQVDQGRFVLTGHVAIGATAVWEKWRYTLGDKRWTVNAGAPPGENGAFSVSGAFVP